jgi:ABC-type lipoprotein release transport system permease subunit
LFDTGLAALDRSVIQTPLATFHDGFYISDAASYVVIEFNDIDDSESVLGEVKTMLPDGIVVRSWKELLPDVVQGIALDQISARLMYGIVTLIVLFSIVNTFIMTIFERTRELGMLLAIGMPPWRIIAMLQLEALWLAFLGGALGALCAAPLLAWLIFKGIPIEGMAEMTQGLVLPTHIKGSFALGELILIPLVFVFGCQIASIVPGSRVLRLRPVEALRAE